LFAVLGEEGHAGGVCTFGGQFEVDDRPEEPIGYLDEQPCSVTSVRVGSRRPTMFQAADRIYSVLNDLMALAPFQIYDEVDSTGVMFGLGPVETAGFGGGASIRATGLLGCFSHVPPPLGLCFMRICAKKAV
jgi:hypothetical protein